MLYGSGFRVSVKGLGFRFEFFWIKVLGCRMQGLGPRAKGVEFRVQDLPNVCAIPSTLNPEPGPRRPLGPF